MNAITAENLGKCYRLKEGRVPTFYGALHQMISRKKTHTFWAVRGLNFSIKKGATIGVIGPNGSGKSSTLGLTAGTISPSEGQIRTEGRISSLLELGAGFHVELTGRENVFLNASLLGIPHEDIARRMDHIIAFSGLHEFIDQPVKTYSSGMYIRLGFAVATEINPDILLIDEVLAVGDLRFQLKCLERIKEYKEKGKTILFVSHDLNTVSSFCDEVYLLINGKLVDRGEPTWMVHYYSKIMEPEKQLTLDEFHQEKINIVQEERKVEDNQLNPAIHTHEHGTRTVEIRQVRLVNSNEVETNEFHHADKLKVEITYFAHRHIEQPVFSLTLKISHGLILFGTNTQIENFDVPTLEGEGKIYIVIDPISLPKDEYLLSLAVYSGDQSEQYHKKEDWYRFRVTDAPLFDGFYHLPLKWEL